MHKQRQKCQPSEIFVKIRSRPGHKPSRFGPPTLLDAMFTFSTCDVEAIHNDTTELASETTHVQSAVTPWVEAALNDCSHARRHRACVQHVTISLH